MSIFSLTSESPNQAINSFLKVQITFAPLQIPTFGTVANDKISITIANTSDPTDILSKAVLVFNADGNWLLDTIPLQEEFTGVTLNTVVVKTTVGIDLYIPVKPILIDHSDYPNINSITFNDIPDYRFVGRIYTMNVQYTRDKHSTTAYSEILYIFRLMQDYITYIGAVTSYAFTMSVLASLYVSLYVRNVSESPMKDYLITDEITVGTVASTVYDLLPRIDGITWINDAPVWFKQAAMTTKVNWNYDRFLSITYYYNAWDPSLWPLAPVDPPLMQPNGDIGLIVGWADSNLVPDSFMRCDGTVLNVNDWRQLFDSIGYTYGGNNDKFKLPTINNHIIQVEV